MKRAAGYIRVSSKKQVDDGESLEAQEKKIRSYVENQGWDLKRIYRDAGISGKAMKGREDLKRLLGDAQRKQFDIVCISRLSRFGRSLKNTYDNFLLLDEMGINLVSLSENIDFSSKLGRTIILPLLAGFCQLENEMRAEQSLEGKGIAANKGRPMGKLPFARLYDRVTGQWTLDEGKADRIRNAVDKHLKGESLRLVARALHMDYSYVYLILYERLGTEWEVHFKDSGERVKYQVPAIIEDPETVREVRARLDHMKKYRRAEPKAYVLNSFIRCAGCGSALIGQTQRGKWSYYRHTNGYRADGETKECGAISYVPVAPIENAVFRTIFENCKDETGFEKAIQNSFPNQDEIDRLRERVAEDKAGLKKASIDINKLIDLALGNVLDRDTIKEREKDLLEKRAVLEGNLETNEQKLARFPDPVLVKRDARIMRLRLQDYFQSEERLQSMSHGEKRRFLHFLFSGLDEQGRPYGVYVSRIGKDIFEYSISARMFGGSRFLRGDDIDYWDDELSGLVDGRIKEYRELRHDGDCQSTERGDGCQEYGL